MLVLGRYINQTILIGDKIKITLCATRHGHARIGIDAPEEVVIVRGELPERDRQEREVLEPCPTS